MKVGIVGCGHVFAKHLGALRRVPGARVVAVADADPGRAREVASRFGIPGAHPRLSDLVERERPDVVHVLTPPATHRDLAIEALDAGCHVLVEKPMATRVDDADAMIAASRASGRTLGVCHNVLFQSGVQRALERVRSGGIGRLTSVDVFWRIERVGPMPGPSEPHWIRELPGGVFHEVAPHPLYLALAFLGPARPAAVVAKRALGGPVPDELRVVLEGDGVHGSVTVSSATHPYHIAARVHGTGATLHLDVATDTLVRLRARGSGRTAKLATALDLAARSAAGNLASAIGVLTGRKAFGHVRLVAAFYAALERGTPPPVGAEQGRALVALLDGVWASLAGRDRAETG